MFFFRFRLFLDLLSLILPTRIIAKEHEKTTYQSYWINLFVF